jgi:hypothetical protein
MSSGMLPKKPRVSARQQHGLFRRGAFRAAPPTQYSGVVLRSPPLPRIPNRLNIRPLDQFRPHWGFLFARSTLPSTVAHLLHTAG